MKYSSKGHKDRNRHKNRIQRSGRARLVYAFDIVVIQYYIHPQKGNLVVCRMFFKTLINSLIKQANKK